jgi:hypothetical protein
LINYVDYLHQPSAVHPSARFCADPKTKHTDAAHASEWSNKTATNDPSAAQLRMSYAIRDVGCPMQ